jgi:hypothetical protein
MANVIKDLFKRVSIDYQEYRQHLINQWNLKREARQIQRAMQRAKVRNKNDGRTYYIIKDKRGAISALNSREILFWTKKGMFPRMDYYKRLSAAIGIVTSNPNVQEQYNQIQLKKEDHE